VQVFPIGWVGHCSQLTSQYIHCHLAICSNTSIVNTHTLSYIMAAAHNSGTAGSASNSTSTICSAKRISIITCQANTSNTAGGATVPYPLSLLLGQKHPPLLTGQFFHHCFHHWHLHHHQQGQYFHHCHWYHHQELACISSVYVGLCCWANSSTNATSSPIPSLLPLLAIHLSFSMVPTYHHWCH